LPLHFGADERHAPPQPDVFFVEEAAAGLRLLGAHHAVGRGHAAHQVARLLVAVDDRGFLHELRADVLHQRQLANRQHVVRRDADALARPLAAGLQAGLAREGDDRAVRERAAEAGVERAAEAVAVRQQHDDRDDAPRDAEHRQRRAEAVVIEAVAGFAHDLTRRPNALSARRTRRRDRGHRGTEDKRGVHHHISKRSASTGGSSPRRRAG
jgi:hypothetical protein